jgi:AcrR family transcriptional regulator
MDRAEALPRSRAFEQLRREEAGVPEDRVTPADAFRSAQRMFIREPRLDMLKLAAELGVSKATLYRWTGSREQLLSEVLTHLGEEAVAIGRRAAEGLEGPPRVTAYFHGFVGAIVNFEPLRRFVRTETQLAFRLLTTRGGLVQSTVTRRTAELLEEEAERGRLVLRAPAGDLAYAMIRVIEGFIYNDALADVDTDIDTAVDIVSMLVAAPEARR